ncbi:hypothetical protein Poly30_29920 [Planctomycetes bacterium Poly30]|uniref:DUF1501 domain-containing protein n=1 Tax=Saltatorellus ferox TaxID=2528018 RepID=A0A518ETP7_9BACT|nr:hypothetical protein Poly30_29920 [Planctomycetes bacterium Poly30]
MGKHNRLGVLQDRLPRITLAASGGPARDVLVFVMLRGGMDGLSLCVPYADPDYAWQRGNLALPGPGQVDGVTDLDGFFGLSQAASALLPAYLAGDLLFVQTAGSPDPTRSHFDAMKFIEGGVPNQAAPVITTGWLGRHLAGVPAVSPAAKLRGVAIDFTAPLTLAGAPATLSIPDPSDFAFNGYQSSRLARQEVLRDLYAFESQPIRGAAEATLDTIDLLAGLNFENYVPSGGAVYPDTEFGDRFKAAAALIKAGIGIEAIEIDRGGWDHHDNLGPVSGQMAEMLAELSQTLLAFRLDLGVLMNDVTVAAMSEFGRRVDANGSGGVDHGRGGCMLVMGGHVNGGQVLHDWVGLDPAVLDDKALPVRIDYRDVLIEILRDRMGNAAAGALFPNHVPTDWGIVS